MLRLIAVLPLFVGVYFAVCAIDYAKTARADKSSNGMWMAGILSLTSIATGVVTLSILAESFTLFSVGQMIYGLSALPFVAVPCGVPFFNRKWIRPFRNLFFILLGAGSIAMALIAQSV